MTEVSSNFNKESYNSLAAGTYINSAPHLRHLTIRKLYSRMLQTAFDAANENGELPSVLDLGAGEGTVTRPFLELGANVVAVDISEKQLEQLQIKCAGLSGQLELRCDDLNTVIEEDRRYDIIVANSLLHHIPDYIDLVQRASTKLTETGVFFCFQDPMWKSTISRRDAFLSWIAYAEWRIWQGDLFGGVWRRIRRMFGFYSATSVHDNTEYHAVRDGVNQDEVRMILADKGFDCELYEYCSLHSDFWQPYGEKMGIKNTFGLLAMRKSST